MRRRATSSAIGIGFTAASRSPNARHGYPGQANRAGLALAEGFVERLIGSIRRECVDHFVVLGEAHLRRICDPMLTITTASERTDHWTKDAPVSRQIQRTGSIKSHPILGGLHHHYVRV